MASREVRYKLRPGEYHLPISAQWPVFTPQPRDSSEAGEAVRKIIDEHDPDLIVLVRIKDEERDPPTP